MDDTLDVLCTASLASLSASESNDFDLVSSSLHKLGRKRGRSSSASKPEEFNNGTVESWLDSEQKKRRRLQPLEIPPSSLNSGSEEQSSQSFSSLFSASEMDSLFDDLDNINDNITQANSKLIEEGEDDTLALRILNPPAVPGLFFDPFSLLQRGLADSVISFCMETYFNMPGANQVMLFGRFLPSTDTVPVPTSGLPQVLLDLLAEISTILKPLISRELFAILFPTQPTMARQAIINLYQPGEGITPHVDLLGRYGDGIVGVSFGSGTVMRFDRVNKLDERSEGDTPARVDVYLPERSLIVLSEAARYDWTHGIDKKTRDFVADSTEAQSSLNSNSVDGSKPVGTWINRGTRMSVTFRWLLPGADVVGEGEDSSE